MMDEVAYHRTCPICGRGLAPNMDGPWTPPWRCDECHVSWWVAELSVSARLAFRKAQHDWGFPGQPGHESVNDQRDSEMQDANHRGVSLRREQLGLIPASVHAALLKRHPKIHPEFAAAMRQQAGD